MSSTKELATEIQDRYGLLGLANISNGTDDTFHLSAIKYNYVEFIKSPPLEVDMTTIRQLKGSKNSDDLEKEIEALRLQIMTIPHKDPYDSEIQKLSAEYKKLTGSHGLQQLFDIFNGAVLAKQGTRLFACLSDKNRSDLELAYKSEVEKGSLEKIKAAWQRFRISALFSGEFRGSGLDSRTTQLLRTMDRSLAFEYMDYLILGSSSIQGKIYRNYIKSSELAGTTNK